MAFLSKYIPIANFIRNWNQVQHKVKGVMFDAATVKKCTADVEGGLGESTMYLSQKRYIIELPKQRKGQLQELYQISKQLHPKKRASINPMGHWQCIVGICDDLKKGWNSSECAYCCGCRRGCAWLLLQIGHFFWRMKFYWAEVLLGCVTNAVNELMKCQGSPQVKTKLSNIQIAQLKRSYFSQIKSMVDACKTLSKLVIKQKSSFWSQLRPEVYIMAANGYNQDKCPDSILRQDSCGFLLTL